MARYEITYASEKIPGFCSIKVNKFLDERGTFHRFFCESEFNELFDEDFLVKQINISSSLKKGTFRGFHYQIVPMGERKILTALSGNFIDIVIDTRKELPTYLNCDFIEFNAIASNIVCVPRGCAHALLSMADDSVAVYLSDQFYSPNHEAGITPYDQIVDLPESILKEIQVISDKDRSWSVLNV